MNIVILDGYTTNSGDLSWEPFTALGQLICYDRTQPSEIVPRLQGAEAAIINKVPIGEREFAQLPALRYLGYLATGYNTVDLEAARRHGVTVTNAVGYSADSVAQHAIALLLALSNQVSTHAQLTAEGAWTQSPDWTFRRKPLIELAGQNLGIIGLGNIGRRTAEIGRSLGMNILAYHPRPQATEPGISWVDLETLFRQSDAISLHSPLTKENHELVNAERLAMMKSTAFLINTARGGLIEEDALAEALNRGQLAGAGLDVLSTEPPPADHPLLSAQNCILTPHIAWASLAARRRLIQIAADNLQAFQAGKPVNVVS